MTGAYQLALTGDVIMNTRVSACRDPDVLGGVDLLRTADVTHAHLEIPLHDFDRDDIFGAAEGAMAWYRGPTAIVGELRWLGVDLVSTASNHALDYSYGGLRSTGASVVLVQGAHAPIRGIEVHAGVPILYDPGPLFRLGRREAQPHDFYTRWGNDVRVRSFDAGLLDAFGARDTALGGGAGTGGGDPKVTVSPREGYGHEPGFFVPVCEVDAVTHRVTRVNLHPMKWSRASRATTGFPVRVTGAAAEAILDRVAELSAPYGTRVSVADDTGWVTTA